ncbi:MAG: DUF6438 domain-containing protein, partial [Candidatus Promineifilaceae bacterium]
MQRKAFIYLLTILTFILAACTAFEPEIQTGLPNEQPSEPAEGNGELPVAGGQQAYVDVLEVMIMESFPVQASVLVQGNLANPCVELVGISAERTNNTFTLNIETKSDPTAVCTQVLVPFEENVALDVEGLAAGTYTVQAGDAQTTFTLDMDNVSDTDSTAVITLERTACFGSCPVYTLAIYDDGRVVYDGLNFVDVSGKQERLLDAAAVAELVQTMNDIGYFELADKYTNYIVTDLPSVLTSLTIDGRTKRIERYEGDDQAPRALIEIEVMIDKLVNSEQWTGYEQTVPVTVGMPNPASTFCVEQGGTLEMRTDEAGNSVGICVFPDGSECEEWAYFNGECAPNGATPEIMGGSLSGTTWAFVWGEVKGATFSPFADLPITLVFEADGSVNGGGGCNRYFGSYTLQGEVLTVSQLGATRMACEEYIMEVEQQYLDALSTARLVEVNADQLRITLPSGSLNFSNTQPVEKTLFVGSEQVDCTGFVPQKCLLVRDDVSAEWEYFYDSITGFEWDFGDGSARQLSGAQVVAHEYDA